MCLHEELPYSLITSSYRLGWRGVQNLMFSDCYIQRLVIPPGWLHNIIVWKFCVTVVWTRLWLQEEGTLQGAPLLMRTQPLQNSLSEVSAGRLRRRNSRNTSACSALSLMFSSWRIPWHRYTLLNAFWSDWRRILLLSKIYNEYKKDKLFFRKDFKFIEHQ